ncbi:MAG TPA: ATP-binding protein [Thermoanaerobaculia bacterium]
MRRLAATLSGKLFVAVLSVLVVSLGALGVVNIRLQRKQLDTARRNAAERMSDVIRRSTTYTMLRNDRAALAEIVAMIGRDPSIAALRIVDANGRVRISTPQREAGRVLRVVTPIRNAASCSSAACHAHPPSQQVLGVLDLDLSLASTDAEIRNASQQFVMSSAVAILLTLITIGALVWRLVHKPVAALAVATRRVGAGELGIVVPVTTRDELGSLARSFNWMTTQLRAAREEITAAAQLLEHRVEEKTAELQRAQQQMIQAEKLTSLGKLAAVVAHEVNNPLSGILTYARLMRKWVDRGDSLESHTTDMHDSLSVIESESRRCGEIVHNLLTFARVQPMNMSDFDVNRVVHQTMKIVEHKLDLANIESVLDLAPELPLIRGDAGQIEQVLLALVMNAIDAMPHEGTLQIATRPSAGGKNVVLTVADDGTGIAPEVLQRLFDPFVTTKEEGKGVGLGLAISRSIVERHNGRISVESELGRGTKFTIEIPSIVIRQPSADSPMTDDESRMTNQKEVLA